MRLKSRIVKLCVVILLACCLPVTLHAEEAPAFDCNASEAPEIADDNAYNEIHTRAKATAKNICLSLRDKLSEGSSATELLTETALPKKLKEFGKFAGDTVIEDFRDSEQIKLTASFKEMQTQLANATLTSGKWPKFVETFSPEGYYEGYFASGSVANRFTFPPDHDDCRRVDENKNCKELFSDFKVAFNAYRKTYDQFANQKNQQLLVQINSDWKRFLAVSKSQTALEVWLTTMWHGGHFKKDHLVGPPKSQVIALHPQLVYEYAEEAADGDNTEFGMAVEWLGLNFWDWKMPLGVSITSVYTDRADFDDIGTGVTLHIDNKYIVGWSRHGSEDGFYFSLDLLKLFEDKKQKYQRYIH
jgi:hypothetical protein